MRDRVRIDRVDLMIQFARAAASRSTCKRLQVGCVISNREMTTIYSYGYNGNYRGGPNECDSEIPGACGCIHAEVNALVKAPYLPGELVLVTTASPCLACAKLILNAGIHTVAYAERYRTAEGLALLVEQGIHVIHPEEVTR